MNASVPQFLLDFTGSLPHPAIDMRKCIICKKKIVVSHAPNKNKQLTCGKPLCLRALKTIKQQIRRDKRRQIPKKK